MKFRITTDYAIRIVLLIAYKQTKCVAEKSSRSSTELEYREASFVKVTLNL